MDTSKLAKRLAKLQDKNSNQGTGRNIWFKSTDEKTKIRQVPYPHDKDGNPFIEASFHYNVAGNRSLVCPKETFGDPCPICELAEEFRTMGGKDNWAMYNKLRAKLRTYSPVLIRGKEEDGVKLWGFGTTIYESLMEKYIDPDWGDLSDPRTGRDLTVWTIPKKSPGNETDYDKPKMDVSPNQTQLLPKKTDIVKLLEDIPNYLNDGETFPVKSYQELQDIVRKLSNIEDDAPESSYKATPEKDGDSDEDDSDLNAKLKALLGN